MSCPDWRRLLADREREQGVAEHVWRSAVDHLMDCPTCRADAFELDPALLFVALPPLEVSDDEIGTIQANVRVLRRARAQERASLEPRRRVARLASAAAVVSLMILLPTHTSRQPTALPVIAGPSLTLQRAPSTGGLAFEGSSAPLIEPYDLPLARIYQLGEEDLSVVMVVDESIDV